MARVLVVARRVGGKKRVGSPVEGQLHMLQAGLFRITSMQCLQPGTSSNQASE
uniref:Uncharacterized protein n=1 Tax=Arundo donax TaxID=35708 RepID=A0A0A9GK45_ARUDO